MDWLTLIPAGPQHTCILTVQTDRLKQTDALWGEREGKIRKEKERVEDREGDGEWGRWVEEVWER